MHAFPTDLSHGCVAALVCLQQIVWNDPTNKVPSEMMKKLIDGMSTLHKLMVQNLPPEQLETVFCQIAVALSTKIPMVFAQVPVSSLTTVGKDRCG